ncbi:MULTISPECIES: hypothetical protein [Candidatus Dormibacteria]
MSETSLSGSHGSIIDAPTPKKPAIRYLLAAEPIKPKLRLE